MKPKSILSPRFVILAVLFWLLPAGFLLADITGTLSDDRSINWSRAVVGVPAAAGVPGGGIPYRTTIFCNVQVSIPGTNIVAMGDGVTDDTKALNSAMKLCPSNQVVYLPAGNYICSNNLSLSRNGVTLRGAGSNTVLHCRISNPSSPFLTVGGYLGAIKITPIVSGTTKGSTSIVVPSVPSTVTPWGATIYLSQTYDPPYVHRVTYTTKQVPDRGGTNLMQLASVVTGTTSTSISFWPPLAFDLTNSPAFYSGEWGGGAMFSGLEDLSITCDKACTFNVYFERCFGCWIRNVQSAYTSQAHFYCIHSACCEIRDSYVHDFFGAGGGNNGEGIELYGLCSGFLVENNIVYHAFPGINTSDNSSGNVIDYNFGYDALSGSTIIGNDDDANHGAHNVMNLWEGNVGGMFQSDGYYGSASHITVFRSYYSGAHPTLTYHRICIDLTHWSDYFNIVGNVLGASNWTGAYTVMQNNYSYLATTIYRLGYPNMGNNSYANWNTNPPTYNIGDYDCMVSNTTFFLDNFDYYHNAVVNPTNSLPPSLFYTSTPSWWPTNLAWPPIGPDLTPMVGLIPAQVEFSQFTGITNFAGTNPVSQNVTIPKSFPSTAKISAGLIASPPCFQLVSGTSSAPYCPGNDPAVVEWLRADGGMEYSGSNVVTWVADVGQNAIQNCAANGPLQVLQAQNNLPAISFDGASSSLQTTSFATPLAQPYTVFIVCQWLTSPSVQSVILDGADISNRFQLYNNDGVVPSTNIAVYAGDSFSTGVMTNSGWNILEIQVNGASSACSINGSTDSAIPGNLGTNNLGGLTLGASYTEGYFGNVNIGEVIVMNGLPVATEPAILYYLRSRWATY